MARPQFSALAQARIDGAYGAARAHVRLRTDLSRRVDIFETIKGESVWLMFRPLRGLYGAYERAGEGAGILINCSHPLNLQRLTAAHEYGHHLLGHGSRLDGEEQIEYPDPGGDREEASAQSFAAHFIMPLELLNRTALRLGLSPRSGGLAPVQVYALSLEIGASYAAVVNHFRALKWIDRATAEQLQTAQPKDIKREIGRGLRPRDPWADTWPVGQQDNGRQLYPRVNDELLLALPEAPSTGYRWSLVGPSVADCRDWDAPAVHDAGLALLGDEFEAHPHATGGMLMGRGGIRRLTIRVLRPGHHTLRLVSRRPWDPPGRQADEFQVYLTAVSVQPHGLYDRQQQLLAIAA